MYVHRCMLNDKRPNFTGTLTWLCLYVCVRVCVCVRMFVHVLYRVAHNFVGANFRRMKLESTFGW